MHDEKVKEGKKSKIDRGFERVIDDVAQVNTYIDLVTRITIWMYSVVSFHI